MNPFIAVSILHLVPLRKKLALIFIHNRKHPLHKYTNLSLDTECLKLQKAFRPYFNSKHKKIKIAPESLV